MGWKDVRVYVCKVTTRPHFTDTRNWFVCFRQVAGIPPDALVEAHGTFATATCTACLRKYDSEDLRVSSKHLGSLLFNT